MNTRVVLVAATAVPAALAAAVFPASAQHIATVWVLFILVPVVIGDLADILTYRLIVPFAKRSRPHMNAMIRKMAARVRRTRAAREPVLPALTTPCAECEGKGYVFDDTDWKEWNARYEAAEKQFEQDKAAGKRTQYEFFYNSVIYNNLIRSEPDQNHYCGECDGEGHRLTDAGRQIRALIFNGREGRFNYEVGRYLREHGYRPEN